jgi:prepilin peptidase CpaA
MGARAPPFTRVVVSDVFTLEGFGMPYFLIAAAAVAGIAALTDAKTGHIPNWLTLGALGAALVAHIFAGIAFSHSWRGGLTGLLSSTGGAMVCVLVPAFFYWRGAIGGGDIKLFAAIGALCYPMNGLEAETYAFVAAALIAPAQLAYKGLLFQTLGRSLALVLNPFRKPENRRELPPEVMTWFRLGPSIFVGAAVTVLMHWGERP